VDLLTTVLSWAEQLAASVQWGEEIPSMN